MNTSFIRKLIYLCIALILMGAAVFAYWFYFVRNTTIIDNSGGNSAPTSFSPFGTTNTPVTNKPKPTNNGNVSTTTVTTTDVKLPILRQLSATPVGGYENNTITASTTIIRWIDRGRGNIYEANSSTSLITTISNTLVPRIYESWWNKNLDIFTAQYLGTSGDSITTVLTNILKNPQYSTSTAYLNSRNSSSTQSSANQVTETQYQLKGKTISGNVIALAVSPKKDRLLLVSNENNHAIGYLSKFDGTGQSQLFNIPLSQIIVDWPEDNTIAITTKAGASYAGYLYFVNVKTGAIKQILGDIVGLATKVSRDASYVFYSRTNPDNNTFMDFVLNVKSGKTTEAIFRTLADKCVWSKKTTNNVYCGVSSTIAESVYPDDWYLGKVAFADSIWKMDMKNEQASKVYDLLNQGNVLIDSYNLQLSDNDSFMYFMNKNDLSLWSLDITN
ncbi:MAG: hypothetical protein NTZ38_02010 [Candidatus Taylorbacteria bacterium]|nr:hypothetical protein [Candidatus Taylorbacteria bacterium]